MEKHTTIQSSLLFILEEVLENTKKANMKKMDANELKARAAQLKQANVAVANNIDIMKSMQKTNGDIEKYSVVPLK